MDQAAAGDWMIWPVPVRTSLMIRASAYPAGFPHCWANIQMEQVEGRPSPPGLGYVWRAALRASFLSDYCTTI